MSYDAETKGQAGGPLAARVLVLLLIAAGASLAASPAAVAEETAAAIPASLPEPTEAPRTLEIQSVEVSREEPGIRLEVATSGPLVWTSYRDADGNLVVELPNSLPTATLAGLDLRQGMIESASLEVEENGDRPLTRLVVKTVAPTEHSVEADGGRLMVDLLPVDHREPAPPEVSNLAVVVDEPIEETVLETVVSDTLEPQPVALVAQQGTAESPLAGPPPSGVPATQLRTVEVSSDEGATVVWVLGDGEFYYSTFMLRDPERFVIDLNGVVKTVQLSTVPVGSGAVERVRVAQFKPQPELVSRVVVDLNRAVEPEIEATTDGLKVTFRNGEPAAAPSPAIPSEQEAALEPVEEVAEAPLEEAVEPAAPPAAEEAMPAEPEPVEPEPAAAVVETITPAPEEIPVPEELPAPEPVEMPEPAAEAAEAPTPVPTTLPEPQEEVAYRQPPAEPPAEATFEVTEVGDAAVSTEQISPGGLQQASITAPPPAGWRGEPITMSLKDGDIRDVLRSFAQISGLNIVIQPGVTGRVNVELTNVPWDQALQQVLKINSLDYELEGNIMRIAPISVLREEAEEQQRLLRAQALSVPLKTIIRRVSYASANDIARVLQSGGGASILSARGSVVVDQRTNTLIIKELPGTIGTVIAVIENLDIPEPQVIIEARIIETTKRFTRTLGVQWDFSAVADSRHGNTTGLVFPNNAEVQGGVSLLTGASNGFLDISLGNVLNTFRLDAVLQAAENEGLINILSAPKITTLNNERASIQSGLQIPIQTIANNTVSVQFINATLRLDVTPHVTAAGTVLMDIDIQKREPQLAFAVVGAQNAPIATKDARTRVIVRDGGTAVIGGIYEVSSDQGEDRVPGLANIPIIKHLFKNKRRNDENEELLIFITPRVVKL